MYTLFILILSTLEKKQYVQDFPLQCSQVDDVPLNTQTLCFVHMCAVVLPETKATT